MSKSAGGLEIERRSTLIALEELRAELRQLPEHELLHQNVVPLTALVTVRRVYRELKGLRAEMLRLQDFEIANLDRLEHFALAFVGAQAHCDVLRESTRNEIRRARVTGRLAHASTFGRPGHTDRWRWWRWLRRAA